jgi:hypothetical protein
MEYTTIEQEMELIAQGKYTFPISIDGQLVYSAEEALENFRQFKARRENLIREIREEWLATPAGKLCLEAYQKFQEYKAYLEQNPKACPEPFPGVDFKEHEFFEQGLLVIREYERERAEKDLRNLRRAQMAARCEHRHTDGRRCGAPRVRGKKLCHRHEAMEQAKALKLDLGPMEDPDSIQMAIMKLQRAVIDGTLDPTQTGQLAYTIQLAAWNVGRTKLAREAEK